MGGRINANRDSNHPDEKGRDCDDDERIEKCFPTLTKECFGDGLTDSKALAKIGPVVNKGEVAVDAPYLAWLGVRRIADISCVGTADDIANPDSVLNDEGLIQAQLFTQFATNFVRRRKFATA